MADRTENIRRITEVAKLFTDAGDCASHPCTASLRLPRVLDSYVCMCVTARMAQICSLRHVDISLRSSCPEDPPFLSFPDCFSSILATPCIARDARHA
jgi:hypothetical protein